MSLPLIVRRVTLMNITAEDSSRETYGSFQLRRKYTGTLTHPTQIGVIPFLKGWPRCTPKTSRRPFKRVFIGLLFSSGVLYRSSARVRSSQEMGQHSNHFSFQLSKQKEYVHFQQLAVIFCKCVLSILQTPLASGAHVGFANAFVV